MSLLLMAELWRARTNQNHAARPVIPIHVASVDHGLRQEAAAEARRVVDTAVAKGFPGHVLTWTAPRAGSGIQAAARNARYALLVDLARRLDLPRPTAVIVGHHRDDQAETFLMRLARGSGLDGLAAMSPERPLTPEGDVVLRRPMLDLPKSALVSTLCAHGWSWIEDPSNANPAFERVRLRAAMETLAELGVTAAALSTSATRLARSRAALDQGVRNLTKDFLRNHHCAYAELNGERFDAAPQDVQIRIMQFLVVSFGARLEPPRMARLEALAARFKTAQNAAATLAGCHLRRFDGVITAMREPGRSGLPTLKLSPGDARIWDNRFQVACAEACPHPVVVRALTVAEARRPAEDFAAATPELGSIPRRALQTLPSFWHEDRLLAVAPPLMANCRSEFLLSKFIDVKSAV